MWEPSTETPSALSPNLAAVFPQRRCAGARMPEASAQRILCPCAEAAMPFGGTRATARDMWASSRSHAFTPSPATVRGGSRCHWTTSPPSNTDVARFAWPGGVRQEPEAESIVPGLTQAELAEALDGLSQLGMIEGEPVPGQGARPAQPQRAEPGLNRRGCTDGEKFEGAGGPVDCSRERPLPGCRRARSPGVGGLAARCVRDHR